MDEPDKPEGAPPPGSEHRGDPFARLLSELASAIDEISDNVSYVLQELPSITADPTILERAKDTCAAIQESIASDIGGEQRLLGEKLHPERGLLDPDVNPDPRATLRLITSWLAEDIGRYHSMVERLPGADSPGESALLGVLVRESGVNILRAYARAKAALDSIRAIVDGGGWTPPASPTR